MSDEHPVGQQVAQLGVWPALHDGLRDEMEIRARVDVVRDAGAEPRPSPNAVLGGILPRLSSSHVRNSSSTGRLCSSRRPRRWSAVSPATLEARSMAKSLAMMRTPFEGRGIARARGLHETSATVTPAAGTLATRALEERHHAGAVALHGAGEVVAQEAPHAVRVGARCIEEDHPACVGPAPHGAAADASGRRGIEHRDTGGVRAEQPWRTRLVLDERCHRTEHVDSRGHAPAKRLRGDVHTCTAPVRALPLDRLVLDVLVAERLDEQRVAELASLHDRCRCRCAHDRVVLRARDALSRRSTATTRAGMSACRVSRVACRVSWLECISVAGGVARPTLGAAGATACAGTDSKNHAARSRPPRRR